jgi:hypothetical protein
VTSPEQWARTVGARLARTNLVRRQISLAELLRADVALRPEEALAIAQQLMHRSAESGVHPNRPNALPPGPPTPANVLLDGDGSVSCPACEATLAVSEVAIFLQGILPSMPSHMVGSVRYLVARALLDVDAPPFDSLEDFSRALARHERGDRKEVVRRLLDRARSDILARSGEADLVDRRRTVAGIAELRRELRERDERVYDQQLALNALQAMASGPQPATSRGLALIAGLAIGVTMVGTGEVLYVWHRAPSRPPDQLTSLPVVDVQSRGLPGVPEVPVVDDTRAAPRLEWQSSEPIGPSQAPSLAESAPPSFVKITSSSPVADSSHRTRVGASRSRAKTDSSPAPAKIGASPPSTNVSGSSASVTIGSLPAPAKHTSHVSVEPPVPAQRKHSLFTWLRSKFVVKVEPL